MMGVDRVLILCLHRSIKSFRQNTGGYNEGLIFNSLHQFFDFIIAGFTGVWGA